MSYTAVFRRHEIKYLLTREQYLTLLPQIAPYMALEPYGKTTIRNIYFDTDSFRLIRRSLEKPVYKEKLRLRTYGKEYLKDNVFMELKKKFDSVVYKRRIAVEESAALRWLCQKTDPGIQSQIADEITYFIRYYETLRPRVFLSYERQAYYCKAGSDLRITFDENILSRDFDLNLGGHIGGTAILSDHKVLMEIKTAGGMPLWLVRLLSQHRIYKSAFSKYGTAYESIIIPKQKGVLFHA